MIALRTADGGTVLEDRTDRRGYRVCIAELAEENPFGGPLTGVDIYEHKQSDQHRTRRIGIWLCGYSLTGAALCIQIAHCHKP